MIFLRILLWILIASGGIVALVVLLLALLLFTPAGVSASNAGGELTVKAHWGLLFYKLMPRKPKSAKALARREKKKAKKAARKAVKKAKKAEKAASATGQKGKKGLAAARGGEKEKTPAKVLIKAALTALADYDYEYARLLRFNRVCIRCTVGGADAADVALSYGRACRLFGLSYPHVMRIFNIKKHRISVDPDFITRRAEFKFDIKVTVLPVSLVKAALVFWKGFRKYKIRFAADYAAKQEVRDDGQCTEPEKQA